VEGITDLPGAIARFIRLIRKIKPAIVHTHSFLPRLLTRAAIYVQRNHNFRHVTTFHSDYPYLHGGLLRDRCKRVAEKWGVRSQTWVTFNSQFVRDIVSRIYHLEQENTTLIYNGVSVQGIRAKCKQITSYQSDQQFNILSVGRLSPQKNFSLLIGSLKKIVELFPAACLTIVGDGEEKGRLENLIATEGIGDSVRLLGWKTDVTPYLEEADLFVLPSLYESFPISILEAGLHGLPVIATDVGGIPEIIRSEYNGILLPAGDRCALEKTIISMMANPKMRTEYGNNLLNLVLEKFTIGTHVDQMQSLYRRILSENGIVAA